MSQDLTTGLAGDLCRYGALLQAMGQTTILEPRYLQITNANLHIYDADQDDAFRLLGQSSHELPTLKLKFDNIVSIQPENIELVDYQYSKFTKTGSLTLGDLSSYGV